MSTYTQDITHLIGKINTNLPDNDTQSITAALIRDTAAAIAYNYDLYVLKTDLDTAGYVTTTSLQSLLDQASYVTASQLDGLVTDVELQQGMQDIKDETYAYVDERISQIPGVDLSAYVTKTELSGMGYITNADLPDMSMYVTQNELSNAGYVSQTQLQQAGYINHQTLSDASYVTQQALSGMGYITNADLSNYVTDTELNSMSYVSQSELSNAGYITNADLPDMSEYVTQTELSNAGYLTSIPSEYITETELSNVLSTASYVTTTSLQSALEPYVTETELSNIGYVTQTDLSSMSYVTQSQLSANSYATQQLVNDTANMMQTVLEEANIINVDSETGIVTVNEMASETYVADYVATHSGSIDLSAYVTKTELSQAGYITSIPSDYATYAAISSMGYVTDTQLQQAGYITSSDLPDLSSYVDYGSLQSYLGSYVSYTYLDTQLSTKQDTLVSGTNIKTINNESLLGSGNIDIQGGGGGTPDYSHVLTFTAEQANSTINLRRVGNDTASLTNAVLQYSTDGGETWSDYTLSSTITLTAIGDSVMFKGTNTTIGATASNYHQFSMTGKIKASGDVTSLLNEIGGDCVLRTYGFGHLFHGCTSLTTAPAIPTTTLGGYCYMYMFSGCTSLKEAPKLPATVLASMCYGYMFEGCTSLKEAPELPATSLALSCYSNMFYGCTSLEKAPELPATSLARYCYAAMFQNCTSLLKAPELPATSLIQYCYQSMFSGCSNLNYVKAMFTYTPSNTYTADWLKNVSTYGTFVKSSSATWTNTGTNAVPILWTVYKTVAIDTDNVPESYVEDEGMTLQVVSGVWTKVTGGGGGDMSAYVTKTELSSMGYLTAVPSEYVTETELSNMGYITQSALPDMSAYATLTYLETYYATVQQLYYTEDAMRQTLIDANVLVGDPETGDWVVQTMASETYVADYVASYAPTPDLSAYVTKTDLSAMSYVTQTALSGMGYLTSANLIYDSTTNTLTINV